MRLLVWNMGGCWASEASHARAWDYLGQQDFDLALLQETRKPPAWAQEQWASFVWKPKYVVVGHEQAGAEVRLVEDSVEIAFDAGGRDGKMGYAARTCWPQAT
jgi:hypothetical protein